MSAGAHRETITSCLRAGGETALRRAATASAVDYLSILTISPNYLSILTPMSELTRRQFLHSAGGLIFLLLVPVGRGLFAAPDGAGGSLPRFTALPYMGRVSVS